MMDSVNNIKCQVCGTKVGTFIPIAHKKISENTKMLVACSDKCFVILKEGLGLVEDEIKEKETEGEENARTV